MRKAPHPEPASDAEEKLPRAGILRFDAKGWRLPEALAEASETESNGFLPGRVVSIITILAVVFIAIIAWFVSHMPKK